MDVNTREMQMSRIRRMLRSKALITFLVIAVVGVGAWLISQAVMTQKKAIFQDTDSAIQVALINIANRQFYDSPYNSSLTDGNGRYAAAHRSLWTERKGNIMYVYVDAVYGIFDRESGQARAAAAGPMVFAFQIDANGEFIYSSYKEGGNGIYWAPDGWPWWLNQPQMYGSNRGDDFFQDQIRAYLQ